MFNPSILVSRGMLVKMSEAATEKESYEGRRNFSLKGDVSETDEL